MKKIISGLLLTIIIISSFQISAFAALTRINDTNQNFTYEGDDWLYTAGLHSWAFYGSDYKRSTSPNAKVKFNFSGTILQIYSQPYNQRSKNIQVKIDGVVVGNYSIYGGGVGSSTMLFEKKELDNKVHFVELENLDNIGSASGHFAFDSIVIDGEMSPYYQINTTNNSINDTVTGSGNNQFDFSQGWTSHEQIGAFDNDETYANIPGSHFNMTFTGNRIKWYGATNTTCGKAAVYIDEQYVKEVDCYQPTRTDDYLLFESDYLNAGQHKLTIILLPFKNPLSSERYITADRIEVLSE